MLQFVIAGLVLGGIYAIASAGLVITYTSSGILNFAFGAIAFFIARFYYYLHTQENWAILTAAVVSIVIAAPAMGVFLYAVLFRYLRLSSPLIKVVATIGLLVAIPSLATLIFGNQAIQQAPGLAPEPVRVFDFLGVPVTMDQVIVYGCVIATVLIGAGVLRYTEVGLKVRAMVDSPAMTDLSGTNPTAIAVGVWAVATFFAGLTGVLAAPIIGLDSGNFTLLIAASFAAVVAAKLRNLPVAVVVGLLMGVATSLFQRYLPPASQWTTEIIDAIPFMVIALFLIYSLIRRGKVGESDGWGGALTAPSRHRARADWRGRRAIWWRPRPWVSWADMRDHSCSSSRSRRSLCWSTATGWDSSPRPSPTPSSSCPGPSSRARGACSGSARSPSPGWGP